MIKIIKSNISDHEEKLNMFIEDLPQDAIYEITHLIKPNDKYHYAEIISIFNIEDKK